MNRTITPNVTWVGKVDWELRTFHGQEYSTHRGSSYNSYLVRDDKTALIDTVWTPFAGEFVDNLAKTVDPASIDYVVACHAEPDHSGALPELMRLIPDTPVYCTANGVKSLTGLYRKDWNFKPVKTGDRLALGPGRELIFIEAPMLHWPDTMFCQLTGEDILFSQDAFGQHLASETLFDDGVDDCELFQEALKYYANILTPFSKLVAKKIAEYAGLGLPLKMICPSHGVVWRAAPGRILEKYLAWAGDYAEDQVTVVYDTMWNATRRMAEAVAAGLAAALPGYAVKLYNAATSDKNDVVAEIFKSKAVLVGSPTINKGILHSLAGLLEMAKGLGFKNKKAAAFGAYGWSGESVKILSKLLEEAGFQVVDPGVRALWSPDGQAEADCRALGEKVARALQA